MAGIYSCTDFVHSTVTLFSDRHCLLVNNAPLSGTKRPLSVSVFHDVRQDAVLSLLLYSTFVDEHLDLLSTSGLGVRLSKDHDK